MLLDTNDECSKQELLKIEDFEHYVVKFYDESQTRFTIRARFPKKGIYKLILFSKDNLILLYIIQNLIEKTINIPQPFPNPLHRNLGPNYSVVELGFTNFKPPIGVIDTNDEGYASISFRADTVFHRILVELNSTNDVSLSQNQCISTFEDGECNVRVFIHKKGEYSLNIYCKTNSKTSKTYRCILSYLIISKSNLNKKIIFPNDNRMVQLGITEKGFNLGLIKEKSFKSFQVVSKVIEFSIDLSRKLEFFTKMKFIDFNYFTHELDTFTSFELDSNKILIRINFPYKGMYSFKLFGKELDNIDGSLSQLFICNFFVPEDNHYFEFPKFNNFCSDLQQTNKAQKHETLNLKAEPQKKNSLTIIRKPGGKFVILKKVEDTRRYENAIGSC